LLLGRDDERGKPGCQRLVTDQYVNPEEGVSATSSTLLERVKCHDQQAWERLVRLYSPLVYRWCRRAGLQEADAADVGQQVFVSVARGIAALHHDQAGDTFRGWLRTITKNKLCDHAKMGQAIGTGGGKLSDILDNLPALASAPAEETAEETSLLYQRAVELIGTEFEERSRQAFWRVAVDGQHPQDVARELDMSLNAVYLAKSHILRRLREEFAGLIDF
jgi:RNA polymerase sigma-70 factor, ECF subfamily